GSQGPESDSTYERPDLPSSDSASNSYGLAYKSGPDGEGADPDLRSLIRVWDSLPASVSAGIMAIVHGVC
ncbi:MAG: hypothetical protein ACIARQ_16545, partial [Phycisphaerales bacterium JB061]